MESSMHGQSRDNAGGRTRFRTRVADLWKSRVAIFLIVLSVVPVLAGAVRVRQVLSNEPATIETARFVQAPTPVVVHIVGATLFSLLGALQFLPQLRLPRSRWHRWSGRVALPAGLVAAATGIWMTLSFPLPPSDNAWLYVFRLIAGIGMLGALALALTSVYRRDFGAHLRWSMRGYALGMGAGTQVLTHVPFFALGIAPAGNLRAFLMGVAWLLNVLVAERALRTKSVPFPTRRTKGEIGGNERRDTLVLQSANT